jgi:sugar lactone lactonase YvrE
MRIDVNQVRTIGLGLTRPEGVMATDDGSLYTADGLGRCTRIERDGRTAFFGNLGGLPNGICIDGDGNCIVANIGNGELQSVRPDGRHTVLMTEAEGRRMYTPNFPYLDFQRRMWVSNSTDRPDMDAALHAAIPDGSLVLIDGGEPRIVADGICFANGVAVDPAERYVYVAETMMRRILRYPIRADGSLGDREVYGPAFLGRKGFPDGIAFDEAENLWVTFPMWNAVGYITPEGNLEIYLEDPEGEVLQGPANICFGWEGRKTAFIGSLEGRTIPYFPVPYPGARLIHQRR